jgi:hypothetical protein
VMLMAQSLNRMEIPVALVVPFDGTGSYTAPKNVACVLNLTQRDYAYMHAGAGFTANSRMSICAATSASIFHDRQVAAAPGLCAQVGAASRKRAIMPARPRQLCRSQTEREAGASCGCSAAAWVRGLSIPH